jgi:hypothetical protein
MLHASHHINWLLLPPRINLLHEGVKTCIGGMVLTNACCVVAKEHMAPQARFAARAMWHRNNSYEDELAGPPHCWKAVDKELMHNLEASVSNFTLEADHKKRDVNAPRLDQPAARGCRPCMHPSPAAAGTMATNEFTTCLSSAEHLIVTQAVEVSA